jgi:methylmalonyl-CoA mutase
MTQDKGKKLFSEFPPVTTRQWEELILQDLKGADYDKKLVWQSIEGIPVRPYYTGEHLKDFEYLDIQYVGSPFASGKKKRSNDWLVRQDIIVSDIGKANAEALDALMKGAGSINFILDGKSKYTSGDITTLLNDICISSAEINFCCGMYSLQVLKALDKENANRGGALSRLRGSIGYDPIGDLLITGSYPAGEEKAFDLASEMISFRRKLPNLAVINVNASVFHDSGASAVQELAFAMASAGEYLQRMTDMGITADETAGKIRFTFASGSNYFMEIAKFRAARYLWSLLLEAWEVKPETAGKLFIHAVTSGWNKTIYDPYVNMLRSTTESMAAVLGGADSVTVEPFDKCFRKSPSAFSGRIARNTQLVLKEEAYLDKVADPAAGSYFIESLTRSLITEAWKLFLQVDETGGLTEAFKREVIQDMIEQNTSGKARLYCPAKGKILKILNIYPTLPVATLSERSLFDDVRDEAVDSQAVCRFFNRRGIQCILPAKPGSRPERVVCGI